MSIYLYSFNLPINVNNSDFSISSSILITGSAWTYAWYLTYLLSYFLSLNLLLGIHVHSLYYYFYRLGILNAQYLTCFIIFVFLFILFIAFWHSHIQAQQLPYCTVSNLLLFFLKSFYRLGIYICTVSNLLLFFLKTHSTGSASTYAWSLTCY